MNKPPKRYKRTSFYLCLFFGGVFLMNAVGCIMSYNIYEQQGCAGFLVLAALFFFCAYRLKCRNDEADRACDEIERTRIEADRLLREKLQAEKDERERLAAEREARHDEFERTRIEADRLLREKLLAEKNEREARLQEFEATHGRIVTRIVGVTFDNEDGSSRQRALKEALANDCEGTLDLEPYEYNGEAAIRVLWEGHCIGNIPRDRVAEVSAAMDRLTGAHLDVSRFIPDDEDEDTSRRGGVIYRADLTLVYSK